MVERFLVKTLFEFKRRKSIELRWPSEFFCWYFFRCVYKTVDDKAGVDLSLATKNGKMTFKDIYIFTTVLAMLPAALSSSSFSYFKNIYTQKIEHLNQRLAMLTTEEQIVNYKINGLLEFKISMRGGFGYPPEINSMYLINKTYKGLIDEHHKRSASLDNLIRLSAKIYLIVMGIVGTFQLIGVISH